MTVENGYVPTLPAVADYVAAVAFGAERPSEVPGGGHVLLPGLGTGNIYDAVRRYCTEGENWYTPQFDYPLPECVGVEMDPDSVAEFHESHPDAEIDVQQADFLTDPPEGMFDWVVGNPPYTRYKALPEGKREQYADQFALATGLFPLHVPFVEQSLRLLKPGGWLTFILPLSVFSTGVTEPIRDVFRTRFAGPIRYLPEPTFDVTVRTALVSIQKGRRDDTGGHLWLESMRRHTVRETLERLDVAEVEAGVEAYYQHCENERTTVRNRDRFERRNRDVDTPTPLGIEPGDADTASAGGTDNQTTLTAFGEPDTPEAEVGED